jgi:glycosyltransferase involved in cell wall biosynthesis
MTILFLTRKFYPHIGGVEKHIQEISEILAAKGHKVIIISELDNKSHSSIYQLESENARQAGKPIGIESYKIDVGNDDWFKKFRIWRKLWSYRRLILYSDIVHCHDVFFWYLPFRFIFFKKSVYTTFHGYEGNNIPSRKAIYMHKLSEKFSNGNICVGNFFKKWYGTKPTFVTFGAVNFKKVKQYSTIINNKNKLKNKVIFFGRLEKETGIMQYLEAVKILKNNDINLELDIYGEGSLKKDINIYIKDNKLNINLKKPIMNIESVLNNYEYIFCSRYLSILEAMAFKKPIFAEYNNTIKKDYLEMTPFAKYISISKNAKEISQDLFDLIKTKKQLDTNNGYQWVKNMTWENMVHLYLRLWKSE